MKLWTPQHAALLSALHAERLTPRLYKRLSRERHEADEAELRRLAAWPAALIKEPAWRLIEPALDQPEAWPDTWHIAAELGVSPAVDHHHALLFERLMERLISDGHLEEALWAWTELIHAWRRIAQTDYLQNLLADIAPPDPASAPPTEDHSKVVTTLLDHLVTRREPELWRALRLDDAPPTANGKTTELSDYNTLRFIWSALALLRALPPLDSDCFGMITHLNAQAGALIARTRQAIIDRFKTRVEQLSLADAAPDAILAPFEWMDSSFHVIPHDESSSIAVVTTTVELLWRLRRVGRDEEHAPGPELITYARPFLRDLAHRIEREESFGYNSKCADLMVFEGSLITDTHARKILFSRALKLCPGHRNASMLLSYAHLSEANATLKVLALLSPPTRLIPSTLRHAREQLQDAAHAIHAARQVYPFNEELDAYEARLTAQAERLKIDLDALRPTPDKAPDA